jgi:hypothetical protein
MEEMYVNPGNLISEFSYGDVWQSFISVDCRDFNSLRIPLFLSGFRKINSVITTNLKSDTGWNLEYLMVPLNLGKYRADAIKSFRSTLQMIKGMNEAKPNFGNLLHQVKIKDTIYYGGRGAYFDSSGNPLLMVMLECGMQEGYHVIDSNYTLLVKNCFMYIHPRVYTSKGILEKYIVSKIIPYVITNSFHIGTYNSFVSSFNNMYSPIVIITDFDYMFHRPIINENTTNEGLSDLLMANVDSVDRFT